MRLSRRATLLLPTLLATPAPTPARAQPGKLRVVASFTILADMLQQIGGPRIALHSLAGPGQDLHGFQPRPSDLQAIAAADLLVLNGLGLEGWADRLAQAAGFRGTTVIASRGIRPLTAGHRHAGSHSHPTQDPHAWQNAAHARAYAATLAAALAAADPAGAAATRDAAARYDRELAALDAEIRALLAPIPRERRRILTTHDAFAYFAAAYGLDILAIAGAWRDSEPSARDLAALAAQAKRQNIRALFAENAANPAALQALANETGLRIGGTLYPDALTPPGGPAGTYTAMMRHNATTIAAALG